MRHGVTRIGAVMVQEPVPLPISDRKLDRIWCVNGACLDAKAWRWLVPRAKGTAAFLFLTDHA